MKLLKVLVIGILLMQSNIGWSQSQGDVLDSGVEVIDSYHYSKAFSSNRSYRIFLPPNYRETTEKNYPVIYFFHGWAQRYFGSMGEGYSNYDFGDENDGDNIEKFVSENDVIVLKVDGLNQFKVEPINLSPYNVSLVSTFRQFPEYFKELIGYIDSHYRTVPDRTHRAVSGLSMGGFMTFWLAAKLPDWVSAAGNFCGSTEFSAGLLDFPVRYAHSDMYDNFKTISLRMHNGDSDRLRFYHEDMNRYLLNAVPHYQFKQYEASHVTCGMGDMFHFLKDAFESPLPLPEKWDYIDIYPYFEIWDYKIETSRNRSGYTILRDVNKAGFYLAVRNFLHEGELMPNVKVQVLTAPIYKKNTEYKVTDIDVRTMESEQYVIKSDASGRLKLTLNGSEHQIGIGLSPSMPNLSMSNIKIENMDWAESGQVVEFSMNVLNKGFATAENVIAEINPISEGLDIVSGQGKIKDLEPQEEEKVNGIFKVRNNRMGYDIAKFQADYADDKGNTWKEEFEILFKDPVDEITDFVIADGKEFTIVKEAVDSVTMVVGAGNGDGIANPGETIVILAKEQGKYLRTDAYTINEYINPDNVSIRIADPWQEYDHIGGTVKYTMPVLSGEIPEGEKIPFYVEYWTPGDISGQHIIHKGKINITVKGEDKTAPVVQWVQVLNDELIEARIYDGTSVNKVMLTLSPNEEKSTLKHVNWDLVPSTFSIELKDDGLGQDAVKGDGIYSARISGKPTYFYDLSFEISDSLGNQGKYVREEAVFFKETRWR
ncbi:alpha/beta hydrolase-fold protein [uncultured Cyclobacterium sp.]|uniref:alpha/beta hydrolase-fold protein n=1 Tax=uncultured Cyclobacterium sp. TaxID=453820 RepID=UPI0030EEB4B5|tara:strand:+ start:30955 stop:33258 length:2304 start_codon:yes stop_codon:yes gene_type:complete